MGAFLTETDKQGFHIEGEVETKTISSYGRRGRPKKGEKPQVTVSYHAKCKIKEVKPEFLKHQIHLAATFVLIAKVKNRQNWRARDILNEYKRQIRVERQFRFLKNLIYLGPIYLQSKRRINALGYVFILALSVVSYLEYRVRKSLKEQNKFLVWPRGHKNYRLSLQTIFEVWTLSGY